MNNKPSGFSLIEVVIALTIALGVISVAMMLMIESNRLTNFIIDQSSAISTADASLSILTKNLRETTDGADGSYAISQASGNSLTFYANVDSDPETELVAFYLSDTNLMETITQPTNPNNPPIHYLSSNSTTKIAAHGIVNGTYTGNAIFTYYSNTYPADTTTNPLVEPVDVSAITLVRVHLDVDVNPVRIPDTHTVETFVELRNLNPNL